MASFLQASSHVRSLARLLEAVESIVPKVVHQITGSEAAFHNLKK